jgi:hypothetical protein
VLREPLTRCRGELLGRRSPAGLLENSFRYTSFDLPPSEEPPVTARPSKLGSTPARQIPPVMAGGLNMGVRFRAGLRGFGGVVP